MKNIIYAVIIPFLLLITVQICLKYPMTRDMFTDIEAYEGIDYKTHPNNEGINIEAEITSGKPSENIVILYNSTDISRFDMQRVCFTVDSDGILQINNPTQDIFRVDINYNPDLVTVNMINTDIQTGIHTVCTVKIN